MRMRKEKLGNICRIVSGTTPKTGNSSYWNGDFDWLTPAEIKEDSFIISETVRKITEKAIKDSSLKPFPKGTVILSSRAPIGKIGIAGKEMYCNQGFKNLICSNEINNFYLYYFLKSKIDYLNSLGRGATFKEISKSIVENIEIPLPNIEEQVHISNILNRIDNILKEKTKQLTELEKLSKCLFFSLLGNPNLPKNNWERKKLSKVCYINPKKSEIKELSDEIKVSFVSMSAVSTDGRVNVEKINKLGKVRSGFTYFKENDVLFAKITPCMENGKGGISQNLKNGIGFGSTEFHILRPIENISNSYWLYYMTMLPFFRKNAEKIMTGSGGQKRVPVSYFDNLVVTVPPIELQNKFAERIKLIEKSKFEIQQSINETQKLFDSLMEKYFG